MKKLFKLTDDDLHHHNHHQHNPTTGSIYFSWQKGHNAKYLVTTSSTDQFLNLYDRYGNKIDSFNLNGICTGLEWNKNGDLLALITDKSSIVKLWNSNNKKTINLDFSVKESLNLLLWSSRTPNLLAITTVKGNLLIYDHNTSRKIPILGKHSKKILSGCWTIQNLLALVCEDRFLSLSDETGDTIFQTNLKSKSNLVKSSLKAIEFLSSTSGQIESHCISVVLNKKQLVLLPVQALDQPLILSFEEKYDEIFDYYWQLNGTLLIAFQTGYIINVQTLGNQLGQELAFIKAFPDTLTNLNICELTNNLAVIRKNVIKLINTITLEQIDNILVDEELDWLEWSTNGQMLAVSSVTSSLDVFLIKLPNINCTYQTKIGYLSSLLEITIMDIELNNKLKIKNKIQLDVEPTMISICNLYLVCCMNNRAYYYELKNELVKEKEYSGIIKEIFMNDQYVAILFTDNRSILHRLDDYIDCYEGVDQKNKDYYQVDTKLKVECIQLTTNFFIWSTNTGIIELFSIEEWTTVMIHRHLHSIKQICPDLIGLRIFLVDDQNEAFIFDATNEQLVPVELRRKDEDDDDNNNNNGDQNNSFFNYENLPTERIVVGQRNYTEQFPFQFTKLLWDLTDHSMFSVSDEKQILVYYFVSKSIQGSFVQFIGKSNLNDGIQPLLINDGLVYYQNQLGNINWNQLETHNYSKQTNFHNLLKLRRIDDCWLMCKSINKLDNWLLFIDCCLHDLNTSESIRLARYIGHAGLVWSLKSLENLEELNLLIGHLAMFLQWFDLAERFYLKSTQPIYALKLRLDLMQWNTALVLAKRLASDQLPFIHKQQANELEFEENFNLALDHFQDALLDIKNSRSNSKNDDDDDDEFKKDELKKHNEECLAGISRCLIKCNDRKKGLQIALKLENLDLIKRTAQVCEEQNLLDDAAQLYEKSNELEMACTLYLKTRNLTKVKELLNSIDSNSILIQYAKLEEQDGKFMDAFKAYEKANEKLDCIRILLDKLNRPQEAVKLVRENRTTDACLLIAKHFQKINDHESAIEFLVYSNKLDEAFELALQESQINLYTNIIIEKFNLKTQLISSSNNNNSKLIKQLQRIAIYYEEEHNLLQSGRFYCLGGQMRKGIKNLLTAHSLVDKNQKKKEDEEDALKLAIEFVCKSNDEQSIQQVIEVLLSELEKSNNNNQSTNDFKYLFKLYMCSGQFREATKTALLLAKEEQLNGNYDRAHNLLVEMCKSLFMNKIKISFELLSALHLLHCYKLAKLNLKLERLEESCELLCKVSNSISKFPKHAAQILSTTILECLKLGYKQQAINYSSVLIQNSKYLEQLDSKFRKKIENLIRKSASIGSANRRIEGGVNNLDPQIINDDSFCPFCDSKNLLNKFQLSCNSCRNIIPFSILTGFHLTTSNGEEFYQCNNCFLPFTYKELKKFENEINCPACECKLNLESITKLESISSI